MTAKRVTFTIRPMPPEDAAVIVAWHYPEPYSFYDMTADEEDLREFLDFSITPSDSPAPLMGDSLSSTSDTVAETADEQPCICACNSASTRTNTHKFTVFDQTDSLIGFFTFTTSTALAAGQHDSDMRTPHAKPHTIVDLGLGLHPDHTSKGLGQSFVQAGVDFALHTYRPTLIRLMVATFNERAIKVYERVGFKATRSLLNPTNGGLYEFVEMVRAVD